MKKAELNKVFKNTEISLKFGEGWVNFCAPDGTHCEFYGDDSLSYLTATYYMGNKHIDSASPNYEQLCEDLRFDLPSQSDDLLNAVIQILGLREQVQA